MDKKKLLKPSDVITPPDNDDVVIWRYMDFAKFVSLLEDQALFFCRASLFDDKFEGSFPATQNVFERVREMIPEIANPIVKSQFSSGLPQVWKTLREWAFINCWHANPVESDAMWRLYSGYENSISIRSTVGRLKKALGSPPPKAENFHGTDQFHIGMVDYIDYQRDRIPVMNILPQFFKKRESFGHEKELRVVHLQYPMKEDRSLDQTRKLSNNGRLFSVSLESLLISIYVAPGAPTWYFKLVEKIIKRYGIKTPVNQSSLDEKPLY